MHSVSATQDPSAVSLVGTTLRGSYRILQALDQGGMGTVFEAEHVRLGRRVALKVLAQHLATDGQSLARFHREAEIISRLAHPHIVQVVDYDTTERGEPYIVMELLSGESLAAKLDRETRIPLELLARIVHQTALGLAAAHQNGVVHRDLKPANIFLVATSNEAPWVKLLDFGISSYANNDRRITGEYAVLGTPEYMPPEQAAGRTARVDHRGDQYSLAVIAYEALAGVTPFQGSEVMEVLNRVITGEPQPLNELVPSVPAELWAVLRRALSKEPEARFDSVVDFATALVNATGYAAGLGSLVPYPSSRRTALLASANVEAERPTTRARAEGRYRVSAPAEAEQQTTGPGAGGAHTRKERRTAESPSPERSRSPVPFHPTSVREALEQAREAFGLGNVDLSTSYLDTARRLADVQGADGKQALAAESALVESVYSARIGPLTRSLAARRSPLSVPELSPEQAFLLSRVEGALTAEELVDLSPLPRLETLRNLVSLLQKGLLGFE